MFVYPNWPNCWFYCYWDIYNYRTSLGYLQVYGLKFIFMQPNPSLNKAYGEVNIIPYAPIPKEGMVAYSPQAIRRKNLPMIAPPFL